MAVKGDYRGWRIIKKSRYCTSLIKLAGLDVKNILKK
jgi:hypothetical protein